MNISMLGPPVEKPDSKGNWLMLERFESGWVATVEFYREDGRGGMEGHEPTGEEVFFQRIHTPDEDKPLDSHGCKVCDTLFGGPQAISVLDLVKYVDTAKDKADEICELVGESKRWSGEPLPNQLERIRVKLMEDELYE